MNDNRPPAVPTRRAIYSESMLNGSMATLPTPNRPLPLPSQSPSNAVPKLETPPADLVESEVSCSCTGYGGENMLTYLRVGTKLILMLVFFVTFSATDDNDCSKKLSEWLLIGAILVLVFLLLAIVTAPRLHKLIFKTLRLNTKPKEDQPTEPTKQELYVKRVGWVITFVTALWCLVWTIVAISKLRKGSRQICGSAFTGTAVVVAFNCLSLLMCSLCIVSHLTGTSDSPPPRIVTPPAPVSAPASAMPSTSFQTSGSVMYPPVVRSDSGIRTDVIRAQANSGFQAPFAP